MSNGFWTVTGLQTNLPNAGQNSLGPFTQNFTAAESDSQYAFTTGSNTVTVPTITTPGGVWIIPPPANTETIKVKTVSGDSGIFVSPQAQSYLAFDTVTPNVPTVLYFVVGGSVSVGLRFT